MGQCDSHAVSFVLVIFSQLAKISIPGGPNQLKDFVRSCPHLLTLQLEPGIILGPNGEIPIGSRPRVILPDNLGSFRNKDALKEVHRRVRKKQGEESIQRLEDIPTSYGMPDTSLFGRRDLPMTLECLLLQGLYHFIYEMKEATFVGLEVSPT